MVSRDVIDNFSPQLLASDAPIETRTARPKVFCELRREGCRPNNSLTDYTTIVNLLK
jgi:hypothetical protein